ncbi:hypothetical protein DPMN_116577 [Dreissena polymorpha]|uniref:Uncharacterized protein n=1 Tax=Dreissena polymorpha TaxID=45954 RepID=A0A9D4KNY0_DREPO|nr:hypothetical protein DPMN_116577 [Dreissena polymorpha]
MESVIDDGVKALEKAVNDMDNSFELAIAGYALVLAKSSKVSTVKQKLMTLATEESNTFRKYP